MRHQEAWGQQGVFPARAKATLGREGARLCWGGGSGGAGIRSGQHRSRGFGWEIQ